MNDSTKNNPSTAPGDWFQHLDRKEHTQLLEDLDALAEAFESLKKANFCDAASAAKLAHAADRFADLESALNAEIFAEEVGILRRCAALRNNAVVTS